MKFHGIVALWLLLNTSVSSFVTSSRDSRRIPSCSGSSFCGNHPAFFAPRGGNARSHLSAVMESSSTVTEGNRMLLSDRGRKAVQILVEYDKDGDQTHVYGDWPEPGVEDEGKKQLAEQLADLDASYPGGLVAYLSKAKALLKESADGLNPFEDFEASVPEGVSLSYDDGSPSFAEAEQSGIDALGGCVFVLVAGGLGERLGYSGIKLSLETNLCTNQSYMEGYIRYIQALQEIARKKTGNKDVRLPLVIMTSGDTDPQTRQMLKENNNFGMDDDMVTIVTQDKVAALKDGAAGLALDSDSRWTVQTKPHGHGDVHHLLYREGLVDKWEAEGRTHVVFLQDTNALVVNSVIPTLGVSVSKGFHMNSICVPRLAGEAAGAIARLEHQTDSSKNLVINVEYNQLDPLLRAQGDKTGDVSDETGFSPFPGNVNNLIIEMGAYAKTLRGEDQGVVVEFVNPKYKDESRTDFKKPTRLECMMQDIPKLFQKEMGSSANIGFTTFDRWFTFSPAKNSLESGVDSVESGSTAPGTMSSAETDMYVQNQRKLKFAGVHLPITDETDYTPVAGIPVTPGPRIMLEPSFAVTQEELLKKVTGSNKISSRSSLVLDGSHISIKNLDLDGALIIRAGPDTHVQVDGLRVSNKGWELVENPAGSDHPEPVAIRGYTMAKKETLNIELMEPGSYRIGEDGQVIKID